MPEKKTKKKTAREKTAAQRKIAAARKKAAKKTVSRRKSRGAVKKKSTVKKKAAAKKRVAASKRTTARKKTAALTAKKKTSKAKKRKAAPKKKSTARKKPAVKKAVKKAAKKPAAGSRKPAKPRPQAKPRPGVQARLVKPRENNVAPRRVKAYQLQKGEDYMNLQQLEHFSALLLNWKKELMKEVDRTVNHMQSDATNFADPADRATQEEEFSLELRTRDRERKLIKKIDEAMGMIGADEYGYCNLCGAEIGIRRLEARPTATLCIDCKTLQELREKQIAD